MKRFRRVMAMPEDETGDIIDEEEEIYDLEDAGNSV